MAAPSIHGIYRPPDVLFKEAVVRYLKFLENREVRTIEDKRDKLRWFAAQLGDLSLRDVTDEVVAAVLEARAREGRKRRPIRGHARSNVPLSRSTLNRYWAELSAFLRWAAKSPRRWIATVPTWEKHRERFGRARRSVQWLQPEQWRALEAELPPHLRQMARFALATGLRARNVTHLEWSRVDLDRKLAWIPAEASKSGRPISVPLNTEALAVLQEQSVARDRQEQWVFPYRGGPVEKVTTKAWMQAKRRAGIDHRFRWHDLRHTWATWHVQSGTPLEVLQKLGGWHSFEMVLVYAHLAESFAAAFAENPIKQLPPRALEVTAEEAIA